MQVDLSEAVRLDSPGLTFLDADVVAAERRRAAEAEEAAPGASEAGGVVATEPARVERGSRKAADRGLGGE